MCSKVDCRNLKKPQGGFWGPALCGGHKLCIFFLKNMLNKAGAQGLRAWIWEGEMSMMEADRKQWDTEAQSRQKTTNRPHRPVFGVGAPVVVTMTKEEASGLLCNTQHQKWMKTRYINDWICIIENVVGGCYNLSPMSETASSKDKNEWMNWIRDREEISIIQYVTSHQILTPPSRQLPMGSLNFCPKMKPPPSALSERPKIMQPRENFVIKTELIKSFQNRRFWKNI